MGAKKEMPRILFIAMTESVHTARWLNEIQDLNWDVHLFPSQGWGIHPAIKNVTIHGVDFRPENINENVRFAWGVPFTVPHVSDKANIVLQRLRDHFEPSQSNDGGYRVRHLISVIKKIKPDIIHTLEMQHAGYLALHAKERMGDSFPTWIYTPMGSDLYFFGRLPDHRGKIEKVLAACDYYAPKSERDIRLAKECGFKGKFLPILPGNGGLDTTKLRLCWQPGRCSDRKIILVKGYQGVMNRALVALHAIELCSDVLKDFSIVVYSATEDVKIKAQLISHDLGIPITILPSQPHEVLLKIYGKARISIGLSISDGVPNSLLESMALGTFPIESNTSCADEWIINGENGFIVQPEDPHRVAEAIRIAVKNDNLINRSAEVNYRIAQNRIDNSVIHPQIISLYTEVYKKRKHQR
jgi:glycosyltransferase involved in cell wall biosynthesis